ncbi:hypothetical protein F4776DRAFT_441377 [Hypoxylon sp. NC0597]|nr:hypothetical protein F4776DRAFT_441377 [Hypoxylon sp. NC0597]
MPFTPEDNKASSRKAAGKSTSGRSRKRARTDSHEEAPRAKTPKSGYDEKHEQLEKNLETSTMDVQDALAELQRTRDELKECKARINNVINRLRNTEATISASTIVHNNIRTEERLERENADLRERIKHLEAAVDDDWNGIDHVPVKTRGTRPSSPLSNADDHIMENDSGDL